MTSTLSDILPVIVLYRITLHEARSYQTLLASGAFSHFVVYDNSPADYEQEAMPACAIYVRDEQNSGLSRAYNRAAEIARNKGYTRLLLLDQDTAFPPTAIAAYAEADRSQALWAPRAKTETGLPLSPSRHTFFGTRGVENISALLPLSRYMAINSGLCVKVENFIRVGGYNERVRLDFSDFQFLARVNHDERLRHSVATLLVLPFCVEQNFSNDTTDRNRLLTRYHLYMESARNCEFFSFKERVSHHLSIVRHTLALTLHTRSLSFLKIYFLSFRSQVKTL